MLQLTLSTFQSLLWTNFTGMFYKKWKANFGILEMVYIESVGKILLSNFDQVVIADLYELTEEITLNLPLTRKIYEVPNT